MTPPPRPRNCPLQTASLQATPVQPKSPRGHAVRIFTGAAIPPGVDTVAMQEDCTATPSATTNHVVIPAGLKLGANVRKAGEDVAQGTELFSAGAIIRAQDVAALASIGVAVGSGLPAPAIAVISSGDEIVRPGTPVEVRPSLRCQRADDREPRARRRLRCDRPRRRTRSSARR